MGYESFVKRDTCPLCDGSAHTDLDWTLYRQVPESAPNNVDCRRCGKFSIALLAYKETIKKDQLYLLSGISREWTVIHGRIDINLENVESLIALAPKTFDAKITKLLQSFVRKLKGLNAEVEFDDSNDYPLAYVRNSDDSRFMIQALKDEMLINDRSVRGNIIAVKLTAEGWRKSDSFEQPIAIREKAFVAMNFDAKLKEAYSKAIEPAVKSLGFVPIRIDSKEHVDTVMDQIIAEIKESRFVIADFTGQRGGVYFEAGFAKGLGLDVIWCCREDDMDKLHFDVKGFNIIVWNNCEELEKRLRDRIRAIIGNGPNLRKEPKTEENR